MSELKSCPFCGSGDIDPDGWSSKECSGPQCMSCGATGQTEHEWNTRHIPEGYALMPLEPSDKMVYATELETELGAYCTSSRQSMQHSIARQVYKAMIQAAKEE